MRNFSPSACVNTLKKLIPLFATKPYHPSAPLDFPSVGARSEGQGRSNIGAAYASLTAVSTLANSPLFAKGSHVRSATIVLACALHCTTIPDFVRAEAAPITRASGGNLYLDHITVAAKRFDVRVGWIAAILHAESRGRHRAISPKGAIGLMQIMPATWQYLRIRHSLGNDPFDPHDNILAGAAYIRELFDRYGSPGWIAAYNAGPGRYEASLKGRQLPAETRAYLASVAPNIDIGNAGGSVTTVTVDQLSWTGAPLFIAPSERGPGADREQHRQSSHDNPQAIDSALPTAVVPSMNARDVSAIVPRSEGLFADRARAGSNP